MDFKLYEASRDGNTEYLTQLLDPSDSESGSSTILGQTHQQNNILHIASKFNNESFIRKVIQQYTVGQVLVRQQNSKGDTPLHIASRFGHLNIVQLLIDRSNADGSTSSSTAGASGSDPNGSNTVNGGSTSSSTRVNHNGSNPLPPSSGLTTGSNLDGSESVTGREIGRRVGEESLCRVMNSEEDTALHEALRNGRENVALYLLRVDFELASLVNAVRESPLYLAAESCCEGVMTEILSKLGFSEEGPHGQNPLHAAARYCSEDAIKCLLDKKPELMEKLDQHGKTALHYAIESYNLTTTELLLGKKPFAAFILDSEGFTPLLRASSIGWLEGFKAILKHCPTSIEMYDNNGQNALHLLKMTHYTEAQKFLKIPKLKELINERDIEGNTPLHLALMNRNHLMVRLLLEIHGVNLNAINKQGLSALDMSEQGWEESYKQRRMSHCLTKSKARWGRQPNKFKVPFKGPPNSEVHPMTDFKQLANTLSVVATLLATVTFAAAFTIPGGFKSDKDSPNVGVATLGKKFALRVFVLADTFAMCSSMTVVFFLIWAMIGESDLLRILVSISHHVLNWSLYGTLVAFISGLYAVVAPEALWVAIIMCIMGSIVPFVVLQSTIIASATGIWRTWHIIWPQSLKEPSDE